MIQRGSDGALQKGGSRDWFVLPNNQTQEIRTWLTGKTETDKEYFTSSKAMLEHLLLFEGLIQNRNTVYYVCRIHGIFAVTNQDIESRVLRESTTWWATVNLLECLGTIGLNRMGHLPTVIQE